MYMYLLLKNIYALKEHKVANRKRFGNWNFRKLSATSFSAGHVVILNISNSVVAAFVAVLLLLFFLNGNVCSLCVNMYNNKLRPIE